MSIIAIDSRFDEIGAGSGVEQAHFFSNTIAQADNFLGFIGDRVARILEEPDLRTITELPPLVRQPWIIRGKMATSGIEVVDLDDSCNAYLFSVLGIYTQEELLAKTGIRHSTVGGAILSWGLHSVATDRTQLNDREDARFPDIFREAGVALRYTPSSLAIGSTNIPFRVVPERRSV